MLRRFWRTKSDGTVVPCLVWVGLVVVVACRSRVGRVVDDHEASARDGGRVGDSEIEAYVVYRLRGARAGFRRDGQRGGCGHSGGVWNNLRKVSGLNLGKLGVKCGWVYLEDVSFVHDLQITAVAVKGPKYCFDLWVVG